MVPYDERSEGRASLLGKFYDLWATQELAIYTKQHLLARKYFSAAYFIFLQASDKVACA